jgi:phage shock protein B
MFRPEVMVFMIPIIAIVMGVASSMLKTHYEHKERMGGTTGPQSGEHARELEQMSKIADILDQRVKVLERILDDEIPNWRNKA